MPIISPKIRNFLLLLALGFCWGPSFLFIRLAIEHLPPLTLVASRLWPGAILLCLLCLAKGEKPLTYLKEWRHFLVMGFFACAFPFSCISAGQQYIPSSLAAIINSSTPIFTALGAYYFLGERLGIIKITGISTGILGILAVFLPSFFDNGHQNELGMFLILLASMSYAVGFLYSRKNLAHIPSLVGASGQVLAAALLVSPLALFFEKPYELPFPPASAIFGISCLAILGTVFAFAIYYELTRSAGATYASTSTLLFPAIAVILGVVILGESLSWNIMLGCPLIFLGLAIANGILPLSFSRKTLKLH